MSIFESWEESGNHFVKGSLIGFECDAIRDEDEAKFAAALIDAVGEEGPQDFYKTWNGYAELRLFRTEDHGLAQVSSMCRDDEDDYDYGGGPEDTPTIGWRVEGDKFFVVASKRISDAEVAEALSFGYPARDAMTQLSGVQGWGE